MGAFRAQASSIEIGGYGTFDGEMTSTFSKPHIAGEFGAADVRAWKVTWRPARGHAVIDGGYVTITNGLVGGGAAHIDVNGKFAIGAAPATAAEEIDAIIHLDRWPIVDLRTVFELNDWPFDGLATADLHLYGLYKYPSGFGHLRVDDGIAWGETFESADSGLRFEPTRIRIDAITMAKGTGAITGAAVVNWDGTYSFTANGTKVPVESFVRLNFQEPRLTGLLTFTASGASAFTDPKYDVTGRIPDLFAGDEGIGPVAGSVSLRDEALAIEIDAGSSRLGVSGSGRIALTPGYDATMRFNFTDTVLDPFVRLLAPQVSISELVKAKVNGSLQIRGPLKDFGRLNADATIDALSMTLDNYPLQNEGPVRLTLAGNRVTAAPGQFQLQGDRTRLGLAGSVNLTDRQLDLDITGGANLAVVQLFLTDAGAWGGADLRAHVGGDIDHPVFLGSATVTDGRIRLASMPHSIEAVNGKVTFDATGIHPDGLRAQLGGGDIIFGGRIGFDGYVPRDLDLTADGEGMRLRYPEGFQTTVEAHLVLRGTLAAPVLGGSVLVTHVTPTRRFEGAAGLFNMITSGLTAPELAPIPGGESMAVPLRYDVRITAPPMVFIDDKELRLAGSAELLFSGTYDRPVVLGHVDIDSGEAIFLGNRYLVRAGRIDFTNPAVIEPFFDIETETHVHQPGQDYRIKVRFTGLMDHWSPTCTSDPPLPFEDCAALLLGEPADLERTEKLSLSAPQEAQNRLIQQMFGQVATSALYAKTGIGSVIEHIPGAPSVQITPYFRNDAAFQNLNPTARLTVGTRVSDRVYLTYSRALNTSQYEVILLEYDQSETVSWVISRNEDRTFALDFRVRHRF